MFAVNDEAFYVDTSAARMQIVPVKVVRISELFITTEGLQSGILATQAFHAATGQHISPGQGVLMTAAQLESDLPALRVQHAQTMWRRLSESTKW